MKFFTLFDVCFKNYFPIQRFKNNPTTREKKHYMVEGKTFKENINVCLIKVLMQGKLFQRDTHFLYFSVLSLGGKVNKDGCHSLTWNPFSQKQSYEIFWS